MFIKIIRTSLIIIIIVAFSFPVTAQKVKLKKGDIGVFDSIQELNIEFDFSDFGVGRFETEEGYIKMKKYYYNKDEPGRGDAWVKEWHGDKEKTYIPSFIDRFNELMTRTEQSIKLGTYADAEYTLVIKTTYLEPGFNVGVHYKRAFINLDILLYKTDNNESPILHLVADKLKGGGEDSIHLDAEIRLGVAYGTAGSVLARYIYKKALK